MTTCATCGQPLCSCLDHDWKGGWRDIATAPTDGTRVLLWTSTRIDEDDISYILEVCEAEHVECAQIGFFDGGWEFQIIGQPTHWMPLPPAPIPAAAPETSSSVLAGSSALSGSNGDPVLSSTGEA